MASIKHKIKTFIRLNKRQLLWFFPLYLLSAVARMVILTVPFRNIWPFLGEYIHKTSVTPVLTSAQEKIAIDMATVIRTLSKYTPWTSNCFVQTLLARVVLRWYKIPYIIYFGVKINNISDKALDAHAWVSAGRCFVSGGNGHRHFTVVSSFTSDASIIQSPHVS